jgi:fatty acid desaturase
VILSGLWLHRRREPVNLAPSGDRRAETMAVLMVAGGVAGLGLLLAGWRGTPAVLVPVMVAFVVWTPLGLLLTLVALATGVRERLRV